MMETRDNNNNANFWIEGDVLSCELNCLNDTDKLDIRTAQLIWRSIKDFVKEQPLKLIVDMRGIKGTFTSDAAHFLSEHFEQQRLLCCEVYVIDSLAMELLVRSYKRIYSSGVPFAICKDMSSARQYCTEFQDKFIL